MKKIIYLLLGIIFMMWLPIFSNRVYAEAKPQIVINSYELGDKIEYGEKTSIYVVFVNESTMTNAQNILVTYTSPNNTVIPAMGTSNQFYITSIQPSAAVGVEIPVVMLESETGYGSMRFELQYISDGAETEVLFSNQSDIVFPLNETGALAIKNINITSNTTVGANSLIGVGYTNNKAEDLKNVKLTIEGEITGETKTVDIGDIYAGQSKYTECYVTYEEVGSRKIKIYMTYEDEKGNSFVTNGGDYNVTVKNTTDEENHQEVTSPEGDNEGTIGQNTQTGTETVNSQSNVDITLILLAIAGLIVIILIILILVKGLRRK